MAIHTLTDSFAHSAHIWGKNDGKWVHLVHDPNNAYRKNPDYVGADDITKCPARWENDKLGNLYAYVMAVAGYNEASAFRNSSYSTK